jgi:hypothetical protein
MGKASTIAPNKISPAKLATKMRAGPKRCCRVFQGLTLLAMFEGRSMIY